MNIVWGLILIYLALGTAKSPKISSFKQLLSHDKYESISVIVAACNEETTIEAGMKSLLNLDYPNIEFILINDRSTDRTGEVMERISRQDKRVKVFEITSLPSGWLGKVHALYQGAQCAKGKWLLFTDADVLFQPLTLKLIMSFLKRNDYDHVTIWPKMVINSIWLKALILTLKLNMFIFLRPQYMHRKNAKVGMGIGAFNLIKAEVYQNIGTHEAIRLCVDDDAKLGKLVKKKGYRQIFLKEQEYIEVEWYKNARAMFKGLEKNTMPPFLYNIFYMIFSIFFIGLMYSIPYVGLLFLPSPLKIVAIIVLVIMLGFYMMIDHFSIQSMILALLFPLVFVYFTSLFLIGGIRVLIRGGVEWRGTLYTIKTLKNFKI